MAVLDDPDQILPGKKARPTPSMIISWLLYPVVLLVGIAAGIAIGVKEAPSLTANKNTTHVYSNAKIVENIPLNKNSNKNNNTNTAVVNNSNANTNSSILNTNIFSAGDSSKLDATTAAKLQTDKQSDLSTVVDKTVALVDVLRQQDLIDLQYALKTYYAVEGSYPSTNGQQIRLERQAADVFYTAMKKFYGGTYFEKIDPESPTYYYGYVSDGTSYTLSAYLTSNKKPFLLSSDTSSDTNQ